MRTVGEVEAEARKVRTLERIAAALERIAAAMEKFNEETEEECL